MKSNKSQTRTSETDAFWGVIFAVSAFLIWGISPIYWKALASVPAFEILMHRMIWSFVFLAPLVLLQGHLKDLLHALTSGRMLLILLSTTLIVGGNWFLFIWAINSGHILQTSLGYYINPLVNVLLGVVWAASARAAYKRLEQGTSEEAFYRAKIQTAEFYFAKILPRTTSLLETMSTGPDSLMTMDEQQFMF